MDSDSDYNAVKQLSTLKLRRRTNKKTATTDKKQQR